MWSTIASPSSARSTSRAIRSGAPAPRLDTWPRALALSAIGILLCFALPWLIRALCWVHRMLIVHLLAATPRDRQLAELQASRRAAVDDATATLSRVERDLHDGTQARLVTIAMALGRAEERLATGGDARDLVADARANAKEALTELRELVRGIHPPPSSSASARRSRRSPPAARYRSTCVCRSPGGRALPSRRSPTSPSPNS
ncbi:histidine kinase [Nocardia fluminea]|uniref:histidine kinase n=1 Tax=Nocardia fluminea TaxID=134984 RepID=UPI0033E5C252